MQFAWLWLTVKYALHCNIKVKKKNCMLQAQIQSVWDAALTFICMRKTCNGELHDQHSMLRLTPKSEKVNKTHGSHGLTDRGRRQMKGRPRERDSWQFWFGWESPSPSTGTCSVSASARSTTICYAPWQYDSALQQSLFTVHSARLQPHGSVELERINNCDSKACWKLECRASFAAAMFNYIPEGLGSFKIVFCSAPTFCHAAFCPVLLHSTRSQYENKWEQWLWKRF